MAICQKRGSGAGIPRGNAARRCRKGRAGLAALLLAGAAGFGAPAQAEDSPAVTFVAEDYVLNRLVRIGGDDECSYDANDVVWETDNGPSWSDGRFARVRVRKHDGSEGPVLIRVEGQPDKSTFVDKRGREVGVCAEANNGLLKLNIPERDGRGEHYVNDFVAQRMELSAADPDSTLTVYRDVRIEPPRGLPDCSDYPEPEIDRYTCLFSGETLSSTPVPATDDSLRDALPKLVQPPENYELAFAEEFNGDTGNYPSGNCRGGLSNLDADKWNFANYWCEDVDAAGDPCERMENGHYEMAWTTLCTPNINTAGKYQYKYGYFEIRYTVDFDEDAYKHLFAVVIGNPFKPKRSVNSKYGTQVRTPNGDLTRWSTYEGLSRFAEVEIDVVEHYPEQLRESAFRFFNYWPIVHSLDTPPRFLQQYSRYCEYEEGSDRYLDFLTEEQCREPGEYTITRGLEWTPRGYRTFMKVEGMHDDFIVVPKNSSTVKYVPGKRDSQGRWRYGNGPFRDYRRGTASHDQFFEYLDDTDEDSVLEQVAISHTPLDIRIGAWGGFGNSRPAARANQIRTRMKVDYVRVFQPRNRYADMEPVYQ